MHASIGKWYIFTDWVLTIVSIKYAPPHWNLNLRTPTWQSRFLSTPSLIWISGTCYWIRKKFLHRSPIAINLSSMMTWGVMKNSLQKIPKTYQNTMYWPTWKEDDKSSSTVLLWNLFDMGVRKIVSMQFSKKKKRKESTKIWKRSKRKQL